VFNLWPVRRFLALVACVMVSATLAAQDSPNFPPTDRVTVRQMRDVPGLPGAFLIRTVVGATGSFSFFELEPGAGSALHHHEREQANVGIEGTMEVGLGAHTEPLPVGAGVISPANVRHAIRNTSSGRLITLEFHTIKRPDLAPPRPRPATPYPASPEPVAIPDDRKLVVQLDGPELQPGVAKVIRGETCTLGWRRLAPGAAATDLAPVRDGVELFVYVVAGDADLVAKGVAQRVSAGTMILIPGSEEHVTLKAAGSAGVSLVEFRPARR
jgi:mannose-6-phosphate isomerase-like protein (cupin superfamily)